MRNEIANNINEKVKNIAINPVFMFVQVTLASICFICDFPKLSLAIFAIILIVQLLFIEDISPTLLPFCLMILSLLKQYGFKPSEFYTMIPLGVLGIISLVAHFFIFPRKLKFGSLTLSLIVVSIAIFLGGIGTSPMSSYFSMTSIYYMVGLGPTAVVAYVIMFTYIDVDKDINTEKLFYNTMNSIGLMAFFIILNQVVNDLMIHGTLISMQWGNNLSAHLLISMPFSFYLASKNNKISLLYFAFGIVQGSLLLLSFSRGGILFGAMSLLTCMVACSFYNKKYRKLYISIIAVLLITPLVIYLTVDNVSQYVDQLLSINSTEARFSFIKQAIAVFKKHPLFGAGLFQKVQDYNPQQGAMYWYHSTPFQIIASFGIIGIIAYGYQLICRLMMFDYKKSNNIFFFIAFLYFEGMCLVNPYDFVPLPYMVIIVFLFVQLQKINLKD